MKCILIDGGELVVGERERPSPLPHQVLVKVHFAGVNFPDIMQRKGLYPPPPDASDLLGLEVSGEVVEVGDDVSRWHVGDKICALTNGGGYAEYVAVDDSHCLPIPDGVSLQDSAGLPETFFTVWSNVFLGQKINARAKFLVHGGSGGIGSTAIQLGVAFGLEVFATASTAEKCEFCTSLGATAINYTTDDFVSAIKKSGGVDIVLSTIGGDYVSRNLLCLNKDGRLIQLAFNGGSNLQAELMPLMMKRITFTGSTLRARSPEFKSEIAADLLKNVWHLFDPKNKNGKIKTLTHEVFSMQNASQAHEMMEKKAHFGKILLKMNS